VPYSDCAVLITVFSNGGSCSHTTPGHTQIKGENIIQMIVKGINEKLV
jgi:hypothetical protein